MTFADSLDIWDICMTGFALLTLILLTARNGRLPEAPSAIYQYPDYIGIRPPPGPPGKAIVGNIADIPTHHEWETYTRWGRKYGGLVHINLVTQPVIFVNSIEVATELLERRSSIYSDRFDFPMLNELMGFVWNFVIMRYGDNWRRHRRTFHQHFHPSATVAFESIQTNQSRCLLKRIYNSPEEFLRHLRHYSGAIIMEAMYGIKVLPTNDPYIDIAERAFAAGSEAAIPGKFLVDALPILKYVPEWVPGARFQTQARVWKQTIDKMPLVPFAAVKKSLRDGTASPSFTVSLLERLAARTDAPEDEEQIIRNTAATAYGAGADTTTTALSWFMLAMVLYPEVQQKAQAELDLEIGMDRLPNFDDRPNLPYVKALVNEVHRWHPVFPLGIPHRLMQDDVYKGMFLAKGSIAIGNAWAMLHDEKLYGPKPEEFNPDRFFLPGVKDSTPAFGFGRRICPGRHMADKTVFIAISSILKVFNISRAKDSNGNDIEIDVTFTSGAISRPDPFPCAITLRSASAKSLVEHEYE